MFRWVLVILYLGWLGSVFANTTIVNDKDDIQRLDQSMIKIKASLNAIDKNIAQENKSYVKQEKKMQELESQINELDKISQKYHHELETKSLEVRKQFLALSLITSDPGRQTNPSILGQRKILLTKMKNDFVDLNNLKQNLSEKMKALENLRADYEESKKSQNQIYQSLSQLQMQRENFGRVYSKTEKWQNQKQEKIVKAGVEKKAQEILGKGAATNEENGVFGVPVQQFKQLKIENPGVSFYIDQNVPILAPGKGKVVYIGALASYGQVIMIDHGQDLRTLILGELKLNIERNVNVNEGDVLGYAQSKLGQHKVYFEVRKREVPQAPMKYLKI
ncbi:MAG: peptidoglycan DD-metalloendopeptidase family protein [Bacteriovoracaceae bacterium]|nr:peptidoglycan DD-metalloendopeptidase family protein [Bacteriovoracaceae bacterium]